MVVAPFYLPDVRLFGETAEEVEKCPWLAQGIVTFIATKRHATESDATGLPRGRSRSLPVTCGVQGTNVRIHGTSPWHSDFSLGCFVAAIVMNHGTSPWHLLLIQQPLGKAGYFCPKPSPAAPTRSTRLENVGWRKDNGVY